MEEKLEQEEQANQAEQHGPIVPAQTIPTLAPLKYEGLYRTEQPQPCGLSREDLRLLFNELSKKCNEALDAHFAAINVDTLTEGVDIDALKAEAKRSRGLTVIVIGGQGEQIFSTSVDALSSDALPKTIRTVTFDSGFAMKSENVTVKDSFRLILDFNDPQPFDSYDPSQGPTPNGSTIEVNGPNTTWVNGVFTTIKSFLHERRRTRSFLHTRAVYNTTTWLIGLPLSMWLAYRADAWVLKQIPELFPVLRTALDIYLVLFGMQLFRWAILGLRHLYPLYEVEGSRTNGVRRTISGVLGALVLGAICDLVIGLLRL